MNTLHLQAEQIVLNWFSKNEKLGTIRKSNESETSFGKSWYYILEAGYFAEDLTIRISDHSVDNARMQNECTLTVADRENSLKITEKLLDIYFQKHI